MVIGSKRVLFSLSKLPAREKALSAATDEATHCQVFQQKGESLSPYLE
jgi:hypothetical protein